MIVGFSRPNHLRLSSDAIRLYQGWTDYSHSYIRFYSTEFQQEMVFEASYGYVHLMAYPEWQKKNTELFTYKIPLLEGDLKELKKKMALFLQRKYGYIQLVAIIIKDVFRRLFSIKVRMADNNDAQLICSELIATILSSNIKFGFKKDLDYISVKDLVIKMQELHKKGFIQQVKV